MRHLLSNREIDELRANAGSILLNNKRPVILFAFNMLNLGIKQLYEVLISEGMACKILYVQDWSARNKEHIREIVKRYDPLLFGIGAVSRHNDKANGMGFFLKEEFPSIPVIFGGVHPSFFPKESLSFCDAVCVGEGDLSLLETVYRILLGLNWKESKNLCYFSESGELIQNPLNKLVKDIDSLPMMRPYTEDHILIRKRGWQVVDKGLYTLFSLSSVLRIRILATRGCSQICSFCCNSGYKELYSDWGELRTYSVERIIKEIKMNQEFFPETTRIFFRDDDFLEREESWYEEFAERYKKEIDLDFDILTSAQMITENKISVLKKAGLKLVSLGLQSGSARINEMYNRQFSIPVFLEAASIIVDHNVGMDVLNIVDNPWDAVEDHRQSLELLLRVPKPFNLIQFSLKIFPGSQLMKKAQEFKGKLPNNLFDYSNFFNLRPSNFNMLCSLAPFIGKKPAFFLFERFDRWWIHYFLRFLSGIANIFGIFWQLYTYGFRDIKAFFNNGTIMIRFAFYLALDHIEGLIK